MVPPYHTIDAFPIALNTGHQNPMKIYLRLPRMVVLGVSILMLVTSQLLLNFLSVAIINPRTPPEYQVVGTEIVRSAHYAEKFENENGCSIAHHHPNNRNERLPLLLLEKNLTICRTPKVGSLELRSVIKSYLTNGTYETLENKPYEGPTSADLSPSDFRAFMYDTDNDQVHHRIMFVRHPVSRILSGFIHCAPHRMFWRDVHAFEKWEDNSSTSFHKWVYDDRGLTRFYEPTCGSMSMRASLNTFGQHYAPGQHCRCGIHDCGVQWTFYKLEEHTIRDVLGPYFEERFLPPPGNTVHKKSYNISEYLTPDILDYLNELTKEEQQAFGYSPLSL